jgi:hypothetical protein
MPDPAENRDSIRLEFHSRAAPEAQSAASQRIGDVAAGD